ncbi:MAG: DUF6621 family protein [Prevotella sp.]|nr:DUF6621 family protein [Prevotella sp.]
MKNELLENVRWSENVIVVDADYVDSVAFNLIVNFERMIGRRIPPADMARWVECVALDGGLRQGDHETQVVLLHDKGKRAMENFTPADYSAQLDGKAFKGNLGEFVFGAYPVESLVSKEEFLVDVVSLVCNQKEVKRVMVVPDVDKCYDMLRHALRHVDDDKRVTLFAMQPLTGGNFRQEILGYSLMSALGIKADEIKE